MTDDEVPPGRSHSSPAVPDNEEDWTMGSLVEVDAEERIGMKRRVRDLQESCLVKRRKVRKSVVETVGLAVELVDMQR